MKVKAIVSFSARVDGRSYSPAEGDVLDMPDGADWLTAGFVVPVAEMERETAVAPTGEKTTVTKRKPRSRKAAKGD